MFGKCKVFSKQNILLPGKGRSPLKKISVVLDFHASSDASKPEFLWPEGYWKRISKRVL